MLAQKIPPAKYQLFAIKLHISFLLVLKQEGSKMCEDLSFLKHSSDISLSIAGVQTVMPGHLFFLLVWWMWVGDRQELRSPKRHSHNNTWPFWINAMLKFWEACYTAWNIWNENIKSRKISNVLHLIGDKFNHWTWTSQLYLKEHSLCSHDSSIKEQFDIFLNSLTG